MKKCLLFIIPFLTIFNEVTSQEVLTFSSYNGTTINLTASTATVNDEITIVFEDSDIINQFYTEGRSFIHVYGGLQVNGIDNFQGAPTFSDLASQPMLTLISTDTDMNAAPNTYSITFKLSQIYTSVADGLNITGYNLLFQNEFGGGGNNQTVDLFIDLIDALKNSTLPVNDYLNSLFSLNLIENSIQIEGLEYNQKFKLDIYDLNGRLVKKMNEKSVLTLNELASAIYILKLTIDEQGTISKRIIKK